MKRFISLFLVFSVLALSLPLTAKERKGADLIVQRTDGTQVKGELIAVKENSLVLLERETGADVTVDIRDIRVIIVVKKSKFWKGAGIGLLAGAASGTGIGASMDDPDAFMGGLATAMGFYIGALVGLLIGGIVGAASWKDKTIQIEGMTDSEIQEILEKLRKKARVRNSQ